MNRLLALLLPLALAAAAQAQVPRALNALPLPSADADRLLAPEVLLGARSTPPDTTSPWRYYPLHVGDAWEYLDYFSGDVLRREINRDSLHNGQRYLFLERFRSRAGGPLEPDGQGPVRFDTTSALAKVLFTNGNEGVPSFAPCPFDAPFGSTVQCPQGGDAFVTGGYDGLLVFGGSLPGTGEDTVRTAWKQYERPPGPDLRRYAADFGEVLFEGEYDVYGLYYARVDGVEHGLPRYPVAAEPVPEPEAEVALAVWPNPARGQVRVGFTPEYGSTLRLAIHDVLGRRVRVQTMTLLPHIRAEAELDLSELPPGLYVVRVVGARTRAAAPLTVLR